MDHETAIDALNDATSAFSVQKALTQLFSECKRPNTAEKLLFRLCNMADARGVVGPFVKTEEGEVPVRLALAKLLRQENMFRRSDARKRKTLYARVVQEMMEEGEELTEESVRQRIDWQIEQDSIKSLMRNISTTISDLEKISLIERHYHGRITNHPNRGAGRHAVYQLAPWVVDKIQGSELTRQPRLV